jgi:DNA-binding NarL/FixJ family response regulator
MSSKRVLLAGHCSPDSSSLTIAVTTAVPGAKVIRTHDDAGVDRAIAEGVDLVLVNRAMEPGYADSIGTDYIRRLREKYPSTKLMLISNYPESQAEAVAAGAMMGFGKSTLMASATQSLIRSALSE